MELSIRGVQRGLRDRPQSELTKCSVEDCFTATYSDSSEYCNKHYRRFSKYGDIGASGKYVGTGDTVEEQFWSKVNKDGPIQPHMDTPCWLWTGSLMSKGYGCSRYKGKTLNSHQLAWILTKGSKPAKGKILRHRCHIRICCNTDHMLEGTHAENMRDMTDANRQCRGERHPNYSLSDQDVLDIRKLLSKGHSQTELGKIYGVAQPTIWKIKTGAGRYGSIQASPKSN